MTVTPGEYKNTPEGDRSAETTAANSHASSMTDTAKDKDVDVENGATVGATQPPAQEESEHGMSEKPTDLGDNQVPISPPVNPMDPSAFPDGGVKAWTVVVGAFCSLAVSFGWINCEYHCTCMVAGGWPLAPNQTYRRAHGFYQPDTSAQTSFTLILTTTYRYRRVPRLLRNSPAKSILVPRSRMDTQSGIVHDVLRRSLGGKNLRYALPIPAFHAIPLSLPESLSLTPLTSRRQLRPTPFVVGRHIFPRLRINDGVHIQDILPIPLVSGPMFRPWRFHDFLPVHVRRDDVVLQKARPGPRHHRLRLVHRRRHLPDHGPTHDPRGWIWMDDAHLRLFDPGLDDRRQFNHRQSHSAAAHSGSAHGFCQALQGQSFFHLGCRHFPHMAWYASRPTNTDLDLQIEVSFDSIPENLQIRSLHLIPILTCDPLGLFIPFTFIILAAQAHGVPSSLAKYLVPILNAASTFGRTIPPYLADRVGRFNVILSMSFLSAVITLALWVPGTGSAASVVFAIIFGFSSGAVASILPACIAQISPIHEIGIRTGALFSVAAIATLIGSPIGGQIITNSGYKSMQGFGGALLAGGTLVYLVLWFRLGGFKWQKV